MWMHSLPPSLRFLSLQSSPCNAWRGRGKGSFFFPSASPMISVYNAPDYGIHCAIIPWSHYCTCIILCSLFSRKFWKPRWSDPRWSRSKCENEKKVISLRQRWMRSEWYYYQKVWAKPTVLSGHFTFFSFIPQVTCNTQISSKTRE